MLRSIARKPITFYIALGMAYMALWLFADWFGNRETFAKRFVNHVWLCTYLVVLNYLLFEYTLPFIRFTWKRILFGLFLLWLHLMFYSFGLYAWRFIGIGIGIYFSLITHPSIEEGVGYHFPYSVGSIVFFGITRHIYNYVRLRQAAQQLRIEKQQAELNYLKSQTNPHFLFNTLNNIYSLARDKSDLAPEAILRLSKILRFMLYEAGGEYIAIEQELKIIGDYIALEQLRYDESLSVQFHYDVEDLRQALPPLLLIPLVENAFKHGVSETRGHPFVDIHLSLKARQLTFEVKNSSEGLPEEGSFKENIGLSNLRRQLELLYREYHLSVEQGNGQFTACLTINLASHV